MPLLITWHVIHLCFSCFCRWSLPVKSEFLLLTVAKLCLLGIVIVFSVISWGLGHVIKHFETCVFLNLSISDKRLKSHIHNEVKTL